MASPFRPLLRFFFLRAAGGDEQIRTVDPLLARQVLSQLSYNPNSTCRSCAPYLFLLSTLKIKQRFVNPADLRSL